MYVRHTFLSTETKVVSFAKSQITNNMYIWLEWPAPFRRVCRNVLYITLAFLGFTTFLAASLSVMPLHKEN